MTNKSRPDSASKLLSAEGRGVGGGKVHLTRKGSPTEGGRHELHHVSSLPWLCMAL